MPDEDVAISVNFKKITYLVSYNANGGQEVQETQMKYFGTDLALSETIPAREDEHATGFKVTINPNDETADTTVLIAERTAKYTFIEWNTDAAGNGVSYAPGSSYTADEKLTLYAQWDIRIETSAVSLPIPSRERFVFLGWTTSDDATERITGDYIPDGDITLYAIWVDSEYTVSYNANGGTGAPQEQTKQYGVDLVLAASCPTHPDKIDNYTIRLQANGGSVSPRLLSASKITSYRFDSWNDQEDGTGIRYAPEALYINDVNVTLYAQWNGFVEEAKVELPTPIREEAGSEKLRS